MTLQSKLKYPLFKACRHLGKYLKSMVPASGRGRRGLSLSKQRIRVRQPVTKYGCQSLCLLAASAGLALAPVSISGPKRIEDKNSLIDKITKAEEALKEGRMKEAEILLEGVVESGHKMTAGVQYAYDTLASLAFRQGDVGRAEQLLSQLLEKIFKEDGGLAGDDNRVVDYSLKLARVYSHLGEDELAEIGFRNCVAIQRSKYMKGEKDDETIELWVNCLFWYGMFHLGRDQADEAKKCFQSAYDLTSLVNTIQPSQVMVLLYNLGEAAASSGDYESALNHLLRAVVVGRAAGSPELPTYYTKIGLIYLLKGLGREASEWCRRGRESSLKHGPISSAAVHCLREAAGNNNLVP